MTHKFTIKPLIKAGIFSLVVGGVFAALAKLSSDKKQSSRIGYWFTKPEPTGSEPGEDLNSKENTNQEDPEQTNADKRSPLSLTPDSMPLKTHWHRKFKWKRE